MENIIQDDAVMSTNDDAAACKRYAVDVGYWVDNYLQHFVKPTDRKAPEINRGYFARVYGLKYLLDQLIKITNNQCQVVNFGAGFDTLFWRLKEENVQVKNYIEIDLAPVTARKCSLIRMRKPLLNVLATEDDDVKFSNCDLHVGRYHLVGADLRSITELERKLLNDGLLDTTVPTIFLAECVLVYMSIEQSSALLKWISKNFQTVVFLNYEQVNMGDKFGQVMIQNLQKRCCELPGVKACQTLEAQKDRFLTEGWEGAKTWSMMEVYDSLPSQEIRRIESLEFLDEKELLLQLLQHYCITLAYKGDKELLFCDVGFA
ncbi:leucine carboxyl methyltransferase 1-like [Centruroides sculpturatus]|uniref:leucine carboxyl methyltransferase 1-like n=1 Tax=Centruroides sculpturatus TaxID=218467 RepID=UPI000C6CEE99|nr:leucine carboxyl methyltransferase 1-like [Centruroides sculpturatus]